MLGVQEAVYHSHQMRFVHGLLDALNIGNTVFKLGQNDFDLSFPALCSRLPLIAIDGEIAGDFSEKSRQVAGLLRGDTVPGAKVSIVDAFFRIEMIEKNVVCDGMAVFPVLFRRDGYRALVPLPKQFDNFLVVHFASPSTSKNRLRFCRRSNAASTYKDNKKSASLRES